jgi:predicted ATPase/DNA-binding CsgD family transcriptional regulator
VSVTLPASLTSFVGRVAELAETAALLREARLLTLTGPGGAGKTRLAVQLATNVREEFPDGTWFIDFAPLSGGEFLWDQVASALGIRETRGGATLADAVSDRLATRRALLVLDNCEHVIDAAAQVVHQLLSAAPAVRVLATSREPLGVGGEVTWTVPPLREADGIALFSDRARQAWPQFKLGKEETAAVGVICRRLDGIPLAIELAAARTRALAPNRIAAELQDHFDLLPSGPRTAPTRQSTLAASFDWSYELLSDAERALLRQLSVFTGGFDVEAALAVCPAATLALLVGLADRSLITVEKQTERSEPRYRMLETVRQFAAEHLDEASEIDLIRTRHRDHYMWLAETAEPGITSPDDARWQAVLIAEQDNLRSAMAWSRDRHEAEALARMVAPLGWFWLITNRMVEMRRWLEPAAERPELLSPKLQARLRILECALGIFTGQRLGELPAMVNEALALARSAGDKQSEALANIGLGLIAGLVSGAEAMRPYVEAAVPLARSARFGYGVVMALEFFAVVRMFQSHPDEAARVIEEAIAEAKVSVARHTQLTVRSFSGGIAFTRGQLGRAHHIQAEVVAEGREMMDYNYLHGLVLLGLAEMFEGDFDSARGHVTESLAAAESSEANGRSAAGVGAHAGFVRGWTQLAAGDFDDAVDSLAAVVDAGRLSIVRLFLALPLVLLAEAQLALGELDEAAESLAEATPIAEARMQTWILSRIGLVRAKLLARQGNLGEAESRVHEALTLGREADDQIGLVDGLELLATFAAEQDSHKEAVRLWAAADSQRHKLGYARFPVVQGTYGAAVARAKRDIGRRDFNTSWAEGARLSVFEAISYSARGRGERKRPTTGWASLTPSELDVVRLVGEHLSNPEIAQRLFVSRATVKSHLVHVFDKLGIGSRSELATEAMKQGVVQTTTHKGRA